MKSILIYLFFGLMAFQVSGQTPIGYCWDFEQPPPPEPPCGDHAHAFFLGCIKNASSSHGTPDNNLPDPTYPAPAMNGGARYAHMYTQFYYCPEGGGSQGEGILLHFNFQSGKKYRISFIAARGQGLITFNQLRLILVNGMPNRDDNTIVNGCNDMDVVPPVPPVNVNVVTMAGNSIPQMTWGTFTNDVTIPVGSNFNQLWFRPLQTSNEGSRPNLFVDNVCIEEIICPDAYFDYYLCKVENHSVRVFLTPPTSPGSFQLFHALDCNGGTGAGNIGAPVPITFLDPAQTMFDIPFGTGCYILQYTTNAGPAGCPAAVHRELIHSDYAGRNEITGAFDIYSATGCVSPNYDIWCYPLYPGSFDPNTIHHWRLLDITNPLAPITVGTWDNIGYVYATLEYGKVYKMEHWVTTTVEGYCLISDVFWRVMGCGQEPGGPSSGSYSSTPGQGGPPNQEPPVAPTPTERNSVADKTAPKSTLFPNPVANSSIILQAGQVDGEAYTVTIYNSMGQLVKTYSDLSDSSLIIEQGTLQAGLHIVRLRFADGRQETLKVLVL